MGGKRNNEALAKAAGFAVVNSAQGYFWVDPLFPENRGAQSFNTEEAAWLDCVNHNNLMDA